MRVAILATVLAACCAAGQGPAPAPLNEALAAHQRGDLPRAVALYRQALDAHPGLLQARINLGAALAQMGRVDDAIAVLDGAPAQARNDPSLRKNLALAYY